MSAKPSLTIQRRINAPPSKVFAAWIEPEKVARWWGPGGAEVVSAQSDPRVGGRFRFVSQAPGGERHDVGGEYREVVPDRKLVFTWAWHSTPERESLVTLSLSGDGAGTLLTLTHEQFFDEPARDGHRKGWDAALDRLERQFA
ncbi:MAG: SRPBCC domain-containing protein [Nevskia sp.]|nr:SRPBCC domain-containing protein [Nevskia sp.]